MVLRESLDPDTSLWDWAAVDLHFHRTRSGLSCAQLGLHLRVNRQAVSNMEAGRVRLDETKAQILDGLWDLNDHFQRLVRYARTGHDPNWFRQHVQYEGRASELRIYEALLVPGLLQTPDYARALLTAGRTVPDVEAAVATRMARQFILGKPTPPVLWVLLYQAVLMPHVGGPEVMRDQLEHLLKLSHEPNIVIRLLPWSLGAPHIGLDGSFMITTIQEGGVAFIGANGGGRLSTDKAEVRRYRLSFEHMGADALPREASRRLITDVMEGL